MPESGVDGGGRGGVFDFFPDEAKAAVQAQLGENLLQHNKPKPGGEAKKLVEPEQRFCRALYKSLPG